MYIDGNNSESVQVLEREAAPVPVAARPPKAAQRPRGKKRRPSILRRRRRPPGQRLIKYAILAGALAVSLPWLHQIVAGKDFTAGNARQVTLAPPFELSQELSEVSKALQELNKVKTTHPGVFAIELESGKYVNMNGKQPYSAASMIKIPIMVSFLAACDKGECSLDEELEIKEEEITSGSGFLQWRKPGTKLTAKRVAELMMEVSDNTATNMIIDYLGGKEAVNKNLHRWGLNDTRINNYLVDIEGTNTASPYDLVYLLGRVDHGELISQKSREFMYEVMGKCKNRSLLPRGLDEDDSIIHKTGTLGIMIGDAGIVTTGSGKRYAIAVQVERKRNDRRANELVRDISKVVHDRFKN